MAGVVVPRDSANTIGRSTNVTTTQVLPSIDRIGSHGPTRSPGRGKARVSQYDIQPITPDGLTDVAGSPVVVPSGWWLMSISVRGNWDDIVAGFTSDDIVPFGAWIAHRPADRPGDLASGTLAPLPVNGGTLTPAIAVDGSGEGDVTIITRFDPCEAP